MNKENQNQNKNNNDGNRSRNASGQYTTLSVSTFVFFTSVYTILKTQTKTKKQEIILFGVYILLILISQFAFSTTYISKKCTTDPTNPQYEFYPVFFHCVLPWSIIFGTIAVLLEVFPGWLMPFSNTFGYLVVRIMGVAELLNKMIKSDFYSSLSEKDNGLKKLSNAIQEIKYKDKSLFVNLFTSKNFDENMNIYSKMFDKSNKVQFEEYTEKFRYFVGIKEMISKTLWYVLSGLLATMIANVNLSAWECDHDIKDIDNIKEKISLQT